MTLFACQIDSPIDGHITLGEPVDRSRQGLARHFQGYACGYIDRRKVKHIVTGRIQRRIERLRIEVVCPWSGVVQQAVRAGRTAAKRLAVSSSSADDEQSE